MTRKIITLILFIFSFCFIWAADEVRVTLIYQEDDLLMALNEITLQTGVNIIVDDSVGGVITVDLVDVPLEEALDIILKPKDIFYKKIDSYYFVCLADPRARGFTKISETELVTLNYISVSELNNLISDYYKTFLKMDLVSNKVSITAPRTIISDFKKVLSKIDVPKTQVSVSVTVLEISKDLIKQRSPASFVLEIPKNLSSINWEGMELDISDTPFTISADIFNWLSMNMKILEENNLAKVHSNPQLLLMNGQQASLFVGETRTMLVSGEVLTSTTVNVGVSVNMLARIYPDFVELILTPEVSHFADSGSTFFSVYRNQISSTVRVPYGETAVVGGITVKRSSDNTTKIPIIGEIPLVRYLFTGTKNSSTERELLILITPSKQEG
ncbi:MAG: hypothetical protein FXF54_13760 [Kosmotoga sp.]|jgi:type IV pilus assembly protein PilQ|nr:MAG: hypothetical protein FXF54_13760 [Kosmotoga sp.]